MNRPKELTLENIEIPDQKLTQYLLIELPKDDKSKFLAQANYTLDNWQTLKQDLYNLAISEAAEYLNETVYGKKYKIRGELQGINQVKLKVITIWIVSDNIAKFVTLIPDKGDK